MRIKSIRMHNFRSIQNETVRLNEYTALIGPNNSGKSNVIAALLFFYDELKLKDTDFLCCPDCKPNELFVDVEFVELSNELHESLPEQYRLPENRLKVRRSAKKNSKAVYTGFTLTDGKESLFDTDFFGAKGVGKAKIGDVIYIPALKNVAQELKTTGSATMTKLLKEIVEPGLHESKQYKAFSDAVVGLSDKLRKIPVENLEEWNGKSISGIECFLNKELAGWDCTVMVDSQPLDPAKLAQQSATLTIEESGHFPFPVESKGQGLQRSLEVALVKLWAEVSRRKDREGPQKDKKVFRPEFTLLLIEEPEAFQHPEQQYRFYFQHPQQQYRFYADLRELSSGDNQQVIASTHSPYFVTPHIHDMSSIVRVLKKENKSHAKSLSDDFIETVLKEEEVNKFRYHLWLNQERNEMFFADTVLLVEGPTEKVLFNWVLQNGRGLQSCHGQKCFVMDCGGKFQMGKFMRLLGQFEIPHLVVHDRDDETKEFHRQANENIQEGINAFTKSIMILEPNVEHSMGIELPDRGSEKPIAMLDYLDDKWKRNEAALNEFSKFIAGGV
jgi:putative ATP-dependent endonuclease of OLD family